MYIPPGEASAGHSARSCPPPFASFHDFRNFASCHARPPRPCEGRPTLHWADAAYTYLPAPHKDYPTTQQAPSADTVILLVCSPKLCRHLVHNHAMNFFWSEMWDHLGKVGPLCVGSELYARTKATAPPPQHGRAQSVPPSFAPQHPYIRTLPPTASTIFQFFCLCM